MALLNHSCDSNVAKFFDGAEIVIVALRNVAAGEEVTENYFPHYAQMPREERRRWLQEHYRFDCRCSACEGDFPLMATLSSDGGGLKMSSPEMFRSLLEDFEDGRVELGSVAGSVLERLRRMEVTAAATSEAAPPPPPPPDEEVYKACRLYESLVRRMRGNVKEI